MKTLKQQPETTHAKIRSKPQFANKTTKKYEASALCLWRLETKAYMVQ